MNYRDFVASRFKSAESTHQDIAIRVTPQAVAGLHASMGLLGEVVELLQAINNNDTANVLEELGDCAFFLEAAYQAYWLPQYTTPRQSIASTETLLIACCDLQDLAKKEVIYCKPATREISARREELLDIASRALEGVCKLWGTTLEAVQAENMLKLMLRHPTGYTNASAQARADKVCTACDGDGVDYLTPAHWPQGGFYPLWPMCTIPDEEY